MSEKKKKLLVVERRAEHSEISGDVAGIRRVSGPNKNKKPCSPPRCTEGRSPKSKAGEASGFSINPLDVPRPLIARAETVLETLSS